MNKDSKEYSILVIENSQKDFAIIEGFLFQKIEAPAVIRVKNAKEAKDILTNNCTTFDIVLLDLSLPDKIGETLIYEIIELCQNIPVIILTGNTDFAFGVKSLSLGVSDYILKDDLTSMSLYKSIIYSSERKKNIIALEESEKRYSEVFHFSPLPMWIVDLNTLKFLDVNISTVNHYGYTREEFLSMTLKDIRPNSELTKLNKAIAEDKQTPSTNSNRVVTHKRKSGEIMQVEIQIAPIRYNGKTVSVVIANDITERLNYINAIESQNKKFKEISWMQSHIIRAPLSRIMGLIPLIISAKEENNDKKIMLEYLALSANELDDVIKNITVKTQEANYQVPAEN